MQRLAFLLFACALVACSIGVPSSSAQSGRQRGGVTSEKTIPLDVPAPPAENRAPVREEEGEEVQCVQEKRKGDARTGDAPPQPDETFKGSEVTQKAVIEKKPLPVPTEEARRHGTSGIVRLRIVLAASGQVTTVKVLKPLPDGLTKNAINAACAVKFKPALKDGRPVSQYVTLEYGFQIDGPRLLPYPTGPRWP
jgi:TonB family protein